MKRPYHHGDLPAALLAAAQEILRHDGLSGLTLRAVARKAGVSHTAAAPHFGDLEGLLSELAASGYILFNSYLQQAQEHPGKWNAAVATAHAYVAFAREHPAMFLLMFRSDRLDFDRPSLAAAARDASLLLMGSTGAAQVQGPPDLHSLGQAVGNWSIVHGFALLLIDGRLEEALALPVCGGDVDALLDAALAG
jgi:AcrR family transcriptional regulator